MFEQLKTDTDRQQWLRRASVALHAVILAWMLHSPEPRLLTANSIALGQNGKSVTRLYWSSKTPDDSAHSSSDLATERYKHQRLGQMLTWRAPARSSKLRAQQNAIERVEEQDKSTTQTLSALGHGAQAGMPYGTLTRQLYGDEIRP